MDYLAKTLAGLEEVLANELSSIGAEKIEVGNRVVRFSGDKALMYRANLELRTALRILVPIHRFRVRHENELYKKVQQVDWSKYLDLTDTLAVDAVTNSDFIRHSHYAALKTKDAIVDQFRQKTGRRPDVDIKAPTIRLHLHIRNDWGTILLDSSGDSLHKRGYRQASVAAPINEVLAAGMIMLAGWKGDSPFIDPMCGSGTLPIEAAMIAYNIPPLILRKSFGFMRWRDFESGLWRQVRKDAIAKKTSFEHTIWASDTESEAIEAIETNLRTLDLIRKVQVQKIDFLELEPPETPGLMIMNPPYNERLEYNDINVFYKAVGDQMKQAYSGWEAWIISSNKEALKHIGLRPSRKVTLYNGALECKFHKFEMYKGTKKVKEEAD